MSIFKKLCMILVVAVLFTGIYGCKKEGPAERAGKNIDNALEGAKDKLNETTK